LTKVTNTPVFFPFSLREGSWQGCYWKH